MGLLDGFRWRRQLKAALDKARAGNLPAALSAAGNDPDRFAELGEELLDADMPSFARAAAERALELSPDHWNARVVLAEALIEDDAPAKAITVYRALFAERPSEVLSRTLAPLLIEHGKPRVAIQVLEPYASSEDPRIALLLGEACLAADENDRAVQVLRPVVAFFDIEARRGWTSAFDQEQAKQAGALYDEAISRTAGYEQVIVDHAQRRQLDARAGVNYSLMAAKLMVASERVAPTLELLGVDDQVALAEELLARDPRSAAGLCQRATAELRRGNAAKAEKIFEQAREADPSHFGALFGYGAAREELGHNHQGQISKLPKLSPPNLVERVVRDWHALTEREQRVVAACTAPLSAALPLLSKKGAQARLLPVDVRPIDLEHFADYRGEKIEEDPRTSDAVDGVATELLAVSNIVTLFNLSSENGLVFAHEFAHLVHYALPDPMLERILALYQRALRNEWAWSQYQLKNEFEFFAVAYTDYLLHRYGLPLGRPLDEAGEVKRAFELFDRLDELLGRG